MEVRVEVSPTENRGERGLCGDGRDGGGSRAAEPWGTVAVRGWRGWRGKLRCGTVGNGGCEGTEMDGRWRWKPHGKPWGTVAVRGWRGWRGKLRCGTVGNGGCVGMEGRWDQCPARRSMRSVFLSTPLSALPLMWNWTSPLSG